MLWLRSRREHHLIDGGHGTDESRIYRKKISAQVGITLSKINADAIRLEPSSEEVDETFCEEQDISSSVAQWAVDFMQQNPTEDVINKVSRMYEMLDDMTRMGKAEEMKQWRTMFLQTIGEYKRKKSV